MFKKNIIIVVLIIFGTVYAAHESPSVSPSASPTPSAEFISTSSSVSSGSSDDEKGARKSVPKSRFKKAGQKMGGQNRRSLYFSPENTFAKKELVGVKHRGTLVYGRIDHQEGKYVWVINIGDKGLVSLYTSKIGKFIYNKLLSPQEQSEQVLYRWLGVKAVPVDEESGEIDEDNTFQVGEIVLVNITGMWGIEGHWVYGKIVNIEQEAIPTYLVDIGENVERRYKASKIKKGKFLQAK